MRKELVFVIIVFLSRELIRVYLHYSQRSSIGAVGVRLCSSAQLAVPLEFKNLNLPDFFEGSGQPLTAARLWFYAEVWVSGPHCGQCHVSWSVVFA